MSNATWMLQGIFLTASLFISYDSIITRHDRGDEAYAELGKRYGDVVADLNLPRRNPSSIKGGNGTGVLIAPKWVLTAAHVAAAVKSGHPASRVQGDHSVTINGEDVAIARVILFPNWRDEPKDDIALIELKSPVKAARYAQPYTANDETGKQIVVVGRGDSGTGLTGPTKADGVLRGATNVIERADAGELMFTFDAPDSPKVTDLEGISGPGDSGGPALYDGGGTLYVLGISVAGDGQGRGPGRYGSIEFYSRVSYYADWIKSTIEAEPVRK